MTTATEEVLKPAHRTAGRARPGVQNGAVRQARQTGCFSTHGNGRLGFSCVHGVADAAGGQGQTVHLHVQLALLLGGAELPADRPGDHAAWRAFTRHVMAVAQVSGRRCSSTSRAADRTLTSSCRSRSWRSIWTGPSWSRHVVVASDHFLRGLLWPESVYGITNPEWWRFLEHAGWVVFEDVVLVAWCVKGTAALRMATERQAQLEVVSEITGDRMAALEMAMSEISGVQPQPRGAVTA